MPDSGDSERFSASERAAALGVHIFTATGAGLGLLALLAAAERRWTLMFAWLALALVVDGVDGALARHFQVRARASRWSGDILDLVVDILTWVFVPTYALVAAGLLPGLLAIPLGFAIMATSVLYFADSRMKSRDNYFLGFPGAWNVFAFYMFLLRPEPWIVAGAVVALCVLTFVPIPFVHPLRVRTGRALSIVLLGCGAALAVIALARNLEPGPYITVPLCGIVLYFLAAGLLRPTNEA